MKNQGFASVTLIIIAILVLGGGYWVWKGKAVAPAPVPTDSNTKSPPPVNFFTTTINTVDLPADQLGWKTYINEQHGFEIKYPGTLSINYTKFQDTSAFIFDNPYSNQSPDGLLRVIVYDTTEAFAVQNNNSTNVGEDVILHGEKAKKMSWTISLGQTPNEISYLIPSKKIVLIFDRGSYNALIDSDMNKVLSTFRFTK